MPQQPSEKQSPASLIEQMGGAARSALAGLATASADQRNAALRAAARSIRNGSDDLLEANRDDLERADHRGLSGAMRDRLKLDVDRLDQMAASLEQVADLPDPLGRILETWKRPNGLRIERVAVPIGVIAVVYESRPNVTVDAAALCLKAGNAVILRGGSEAVHSNRALHRLLADAVRETGLDRNAVQMVPSQDRALVGALLAAPQWIDVIVPRGGRSLVERVQTEARVPVFAHLEGVNHLYVHAAADPAMAIDLITNSKMRRPGICGALETIVFDRQCLDWLPRLIDSLDSLGCEVRGDKRARQADARIKEADDADWHAEYLDTIVALRVVDGTDEAIEHIAEFGSGHTDGIITDDDSAAADFMARVDSAIVVHNASTQFADGGEFGFGAEIGIATGRLHARGPVGPEQLTTFKYRVHGRGHTRPF